MEYSERASTSSYYRGRMGEPDLYHARMGEPEAHREGKEEADDYLEKLLELKEDRCRRLQDLIALKEARLAQLRGAAASPTPEAPPHTAAAIAAATAARCAAQQLLHGAGERDHTQQRSSGQAPAWGAARVSADDTLAGALRHEQARPRRTPAVRAAA